jgi:hypothetical protein
MGSVERDELNAIVGEEARPAKTVITSQFLNCRLEGGEALRVFAQNADKLRVVANGFGGFLAEAGLLLQQKETTDFLDVVIARAHNEAFKRNSRYILKLAEELDRDRECVNMPPIDEVAGYDNKYQFGVAKVAQILAEGAKNSTGRISGIEMQVA